MNELKELKYVIIFAGISTIIFAIMISIFSPKPSVSTEEFIDVGTVYSIERSNNTFRNLCLFRIPINTADTYDVTVICDNKNVMTFVIPQTDELCEENSRVIVYRDVYTTQKHKIRYGDYHIRSLAK